MKPGDLRVDESVGDVFRHVINDSPGYPDKHYLEHLRSVALSGEANSRITIGAKRKLADIAFEYGSKNHAMIIWRSLSDNAETRL